MGLSRQPDGGLSEGPDGSRPRSDGREDGSGHGPRDVEEDDGVLRVGADGVNGRTGATPLGRQQTFLREMLAPDDGMDAQWDDGAGGGGSGSGNGSGNGSGMDVLAVLAEQAQGREVTLDEDEGPAAFRLGE